MSASHPATIVRIAVVDHDLDADLRRDDPNYTGGMPTEADILDRLRQYAVDDGEVRAAVSELGEKAASEIFAEVWKREEEAKR